MHAVDRACVTISGTRLRLSSNFWIELLDETESFHGSVSDGFLQLLLLGDECGKFIITVMQFQDTPVFLKTLREFFYLIKVRLDKNCIIFLCFVHVIVDGRDIVDCLI